MYKLNFSGIAGNTIQFNPLDGYISSESVLTLIYKVLPPYYILATYSTLGGLQIDPTIAVFVSTTFEEEHVYVSSRNTILHRSTNALLLNIFIMVPGGGGGGARPPRWIRP